MTTAPPAWSRLAPWRGIIAGVFLLLAVVAVYLPVRHAGFIWDDDVLVTRNPCVIGPLGLRAIWTTRAADICPLTLSTFRLEHACWGLDPRFYHGFNVLLHGACAWLLWRVLRALAVPGAWLGTALWALHPVQVESVAWVTEMKNTQSGVFYLLTILCFLRWRADGRRWLYALMVVCAAMAMASKTSTVVLPAVLCLLAWWQDGRWRWRTLGAVAPLFLLSLAATILSLWTQTPASGTDAAVVGHGVAWRLAVAGRAAWFYLGKLAWSHPLMTVYPRWEINVHAWSAFVPALAGVALLAGLWTARRRAGMAGGWLAAAYFVVALLPTLGVAELTYFRHAFVADHFLYLGSMGPLALVGAGVTSLPRTPRFLPLAAGAALALTLGGMTWQRSQVYENQRTLWTDALAKNPACWEGHDKLGDLALQDGQADAAAREFRAAIGIHPDDFDAHNNLGNAYLSQERLTEAAGQYETACQLAPDRLVARINFGAVLKMLGRMDEAAAQLRAVLAADPREAGGHTGLGDIFLQTGRVDEAIAEYQAALAGTANTALVRYNLGNAFMRRGWTDRAVGQYREAVRLDPGDAAMRLNLGTAYLTRGQTDEATAQYREAVRLKPGTPLVHVNLGVAHTRAGRLAEAAAEFQEALRLQPGDRAAQDYLTKVQAMAQEADSAK